MLYALIIFLFLSLPCSEHRITYYTPGVGCGFVCADGTRIVDADAQRIAAVSPAAERMFPMHSLIWVEGHSRGLYIVRDRAAGWLDARWPEGTVDLCVDPPRQGRAWLRVWRICSITN